MSKPLPRDQSGGEALAIRGEESRPGGVLVILIIILSEVEQRDGFF